MKFPAASSISNVWALRGNAHPEKNGRNTILLPRLRSVPYAPPAFYSERQKHFFFRAKKGDLGRVPGARKRKEREAGSPLAGTGAGLAPGTPRRCSPRPSWDFLCVMMHLLIWPSMRYSACVWLCVCVREREGDRERVGGG